MADNLREARVDRYLIERIAYAGNLDTDLPDVPDITVVTDPSIWLKLLKPGKARGEAEATLSSALMAWKREMKTWTRSTLSDVARKLEELFWRPALDEVNNALDERVASIQAELESRELGNRNAETEAEKIDAELRGIRERLSEVKELQDRSSELWNDL